MSTGICCLSLSLQLCSLHTSSSSVLSALLLLSLYKGEENAHTRKGKEDSGWKWLVLHPGRSSGRANNPRIAGVDPQLLLLVWQAPKAGNTDPRVGQDTPARAGTAPGPGCCEQGDSPGCCCSSQLRAMGRSSSLLPDKKQSLELDSARAADLSPSPALVTFLCSPCPVCPQPAQHGHHPGWGWTAGTCPPHRSHQKGNTELGEPPEHRNSGENACLCESTRRQIVDIKLLGRLWDWAVPFSPHTKGSFLSRCKTEPY